MGIIHKLFTCLNMLKDFEAEYSSDDVNDGLMMIKYRETNYAVKVVEMKDAKFNFDSLSRVKYYF